MLRITPGQSKLLFFLYFTLILYVSLSKGVGNLNLSGQRLAGFRLDYLLHLGAYFSFYAGYLILGWLGNPPFQRHALLKIIVLTAALGIGTEFLQRLTPNRSFNLHDMAFNGLGILLGIITVLLLRKTLLPARMEN